MLLISFWQVLMFLIAFRSLKQAKNEGKLGVVHGKARLKLNYTKNPSLGELRSLFQINQVCKEENQRRNLTFMKFASTCEIFASLWIAQEGISQALWNRGGISQPLAKCLQARRNFTSLTKLMNFSNPCEIFATPCKIFATFWNLHVILDIFTPTPLDFYLKIFCVITYSLLVIS